MLERKIDVITEKLLHSEYWEKINEFNIENVSFIYLYWIFRKEKINIKEIYLHNVISKWLSMQNLESSATFSKLKKLLRKTKIKLNDIESFEIDLLEERLFSLNRHIKALDVNYELLPKEKIWIKFVDAKLKVVEKSELLETIGNLMISQERIIIDGKSEINFEIFFKNINMITFEKDEMIITTNKENFVISISIHDIETLKNTMKNASNKKIPILNKLLLLKI